MNSSDLINKSIRTKSLEDKSSRLNRPTKLDIKRPAMLADDSIGKRVNSSKIPRLQVPAAFRYKVNLKNHQTRSSIKRQQSLIPRLNSRKQDEVEKFKFDVFSKAESLKKKPNKIQERLVDSEFKEFVFGEGNKKVSNPNSENSSLKSFHTLKEDESDSIYKDAVEDIYCCLRSSRADSKNDQEVNTETTKTERQDKIIRNFYESIKYVAGPLLDKINLTSEKNILSKLFQIHSTTTQVIEGTENAVDSVPDFSTIQGQYEFTLREISNIWKNAISLIGSVKEHTVKFVEENDKSLDKEQLTLEAEMLQLAIDFAISYSKLKTDFLIKSAKKRFGIKGLEKSELENFMDSKTFSCLYNNDDLAAMARTVQDLNVSVSKGVEFEPE